MFCSTVKILYECYNAIIKSFIKLIKIISLNENKKEKTFFSKESINKYVNVTVNKCKEVKSNKIKKLVFFLTQLGQFLLQI